MLGEAAGRLDQEPGAGRTGLIGQDLAEGDPGAVIDGRVDTVVADPPAPALLSPAVAAVAAAVRDAPQRWTSRWTSSPGTPAGSGP
jgi:hypothetical protein